MSTAHLVEPHLAGFQDDFNALRHELAKVVVGHADVIEQVLIAAVAGGHVLIQGVPGLGKTLLVETLADILQLRFSRIQFTPDLTPSDLLGTFVVMENAAGRRTFEFQQGPIFSNRCWPTMSIAACRRRSRPCSRRWRARRSTSRPRPSTCRSRSSWSARRIRWRWKVSVET